MKYTFTVLFIVVLFLLYVFINKLLFSNERTRKGVTTLQQSQFNNYLQESQENGISYCKTVNDYSVAPFREGLVNNTYDYSDISDSINSAITEIKANLSDVSTNLNHIRSKL